MTGCPLHRVRAWLAVAIALALAGAGCSSSTKAAAPAKTSAGPTAWEAILSQFPADGTVPKQLALEAFALASGAKIPGVVVPAGARPKGIPLSGPLRWVAGVRDQLSAPERTAVEAVLGAGVLDGSGPSPAGGSGKARPMSARPATGKAPPSAGCVAGSWTADGKDWHGAVLGAVKRVGDKLGKQLPGDFVRCVVDRTKEDLPPDTEPALTQAWNPGGVLTGCFMSILPAITGYTPDQVTSVLLHEIYHCYEMWSLGSYNSWADSPSWITEGEARWVGEELLPTHLPEVDASEVLYLNGTQSLFAKSYGAFGFYAHLKDSGIDPWPLLLPILGEWRKGNQASFDKAFENAGDAKKAFFESWASSVQRYAPPPNPAWTLTGPGSMVDVASVPASPVSGGTIEAGSSFVPAVTREVGGMSHYDLDVRTDLVVIATDGGPGTQPLRVTDLVHDQVVSGGSVELCMRAEGCQCPGASGAGAAAAAGEGGPWQSPLRVSVLGDVNQDPKSWTMTGESLDSKCHKTTTTTPTGDASPCAKGCGGDNGDPHLLTIDGTFYDFQAAGEFTLLRSPDGATAIQGRQEVVGPANVATINTALALRAGGHRFVVTLADSLHLAVDGVATDATGGPLAGGVVLHPYKQGWQFDLPDGTTVWALSLGHWGINIEVRPSADLRAKGQGLLATSATTGIHLPLLPDGTAVPTPSSPDERYDLLYHRFGDAWRLSDAETAFDYEAGKSTASYTNRDVPVRTAPTKAADLTSDQQTAATAACAGVDDPHLHEGCLFDVGVTGDKGYATQAQATGRFFSRGVRSLDEDLSSGSGSTSAGTGFHIVAVPDLQVEGVDTGSEALGPDGSVFVVAVQFLPSTVDPPVELDWIDRTGAVKGHIKRTENKVNFTYAAGSLWVETLAASPDYRCVVQRLDPASGTEQAKVSVDCALGLTGGLATFADAPWFVTLDAAHHVSVVRIDPATNQVGQSISSPTSSPAFPKLSATAKALFLVSGTVARIHPSDGSVDTIVDDTRRLDVFPVGDGVWTGADDQGRISYYNAPGGPQRTVTIAVGARGGAPFSVSPTAFLFGADDQHIYTERTPVEDTGPIYQAGNDGSGAQQIAPASQDNFAHGSHPLATPGGFVLVTVGLQPTGGGGFGLQLQQLATA